MAQKPMLRAEVYARALRASKNKLELELIQTQTYVTKGTTLK